MVLLFKDFYNVTKTSNVQNISINQKNGDHFERTHNNVERPQMIIFPILFTKHIFLSHLIQVSFMHKIRNNFFFFYNVTMTQHLQNISMNHRKEWTILMKYKTMLIHNI